GKLAAFSAVWYVDSFFRWYRCPPTSALFPYTTLFRSRICINHQDVLRAKVRQLDADAIGMLGGIQLYAVEIDGTHRIGDGIDERSEEHTSELQSRENLVCRLLLVKKK